MHEKAIGAGLRVVVEREGISVVVTVGVHQVVAIGGVPDTVTGIDPVPATLATTRMLCPEYAAHADNAFRPVVARIGDGR